MSESLKFGDLLDVVRRYSRPVRVLVLSVILPLLLLAGHESYHWPEGWPTHALWLNLLIAGGLTLVIVGLVLIDPDEKASLDKLPEAKPVMEHSLKYFKLERRLSAGRKDLTREVENRIRKEGFALSRQDMGRCEAGPWEFDRIVYHLLVRYQAQATVEDRMRGVKQEKLVLDTTSWKGSLVPMHYAIEAVFDSTESSQRPALGQPELQLITEILNKLNGWKTRLWRRLHLDVRGNGIIKNCKAILDR